ncbi:BnaC03g55170D [Brassica napus]|uniref:BnaC03g55170D protein n=1 Tax=Brassica napus TaxID=3708 RepID=A0A078H2G4_BRANA|nr:BnaC03g55170D [Brassica napus]
MVGNRKPHADYGPLGKRKPRADYGSPLNSYLKPFCFVKLLRRSETDAVVGDHNISSSDCKFIIFTDLFRLTMGLPELLKWVYTLGEEPFTAKSIAYHTDNSNLLLALRDALNDDEYEELKESKLGLFIKFKEMNFDWASRLVHYMLGFQLDIKKKCELWCLVGPKPVRFSLIEFKFLTVLNCDYIEDIENPRCVVTKEMEVFWELMGVDFDAGPATEQIIAASIFSGFIEGRKYSLATRACLARLVMDLELFEN